MKKILLAYSFGVASLSLLTSCNSQNSATTKNKEFRFKELIQNVKAKNIIDGYVLQLKNHQENNFTLV